MSDQLKYAQLQNFSLAGAGALIGDTTLILKSMTDIDGNALSMSNFGTQGFGTIEPGSGDQEEQIVFTGLTNNANGTTTLTGVSSVSFLSPYTQTPGLAKTHPGSTVFVISNTAGFYDTFTNKNDDETITGTWLVPDPTVATQIANKEYIDNIAIAGAPAASDTVPGIAIEATQDQVNAGTPSEVYSGNGQTYRLFVNPSTLINSTNAINNIVSGENLTAGKPVYINPTDSSAYTAHGFKELDSTSLNLTASTSNKVAKLSDTQMMFLTDNGTTTLTITVFDINSAASVATATVTTAYDQSPTVGTTTLPSATMCRLSDTTFVVFYAHTGTNNLYFRTGSISGAVITMDTETAYPGSPTYCFGYSAVPGASDGKVVFTYFDGTGEPGAGATPQDCHLSYLTVTTNSVTVTTDTSYTVVSGAYFTNPRWSTACFTNGIAYGLFSCSNSGGVNDINYSWINTFDSTTGTQLYTTNLENNTGSGVSAAYSSIIPYFVGHNGKGYFGYSTFDAAAGIDITTKTVLEIDRIGCRVVYQTSNVSGTGDQTVAALPMFGNEQGLIVFKFPKSGSGGVLTGSIYIQKDTITSFFDVQVLSSNDTLPQAQAWYSNTRDEIIPVYVDPTTGYIKQWKLPTLVDGLALASVTAPAVVSIQNGLFTTSGLTANAQYFLKDTYTTAGDLALSGVIPVGQALSTTVLRYKDF